MTVSVFSFVIVKLGDACLVEWKVGLLLHLDQKQPSLYLRAIAGWKCQGQNI